MITLMYHDVVAGNQYASSGFSSPAAHYYKLDQQRFQAHLSAISTAINEVGLVSENTVQGDNGKVLLTFDDGGSSAPLIASMLESRGWRGHFLIPTDYLGKSGFVKASQVRELRQMGHVIGTHSCSHPERMSHLPWEEMVREWTESRDSLRQVLGEDVNVASVPGGYYSRKVALAASEAGLRFLFTSEPDTRINTVKDTIVIGRFTIKRNTPAVTAANLAAHHWKETTVQWLLWNTKKIAKRAGGKAYLSARKKLLTGS